MLKINDDPFSEHPVVTTESSDGIQTQHFLTNCKHWRAVFVKMERRNKGHEHENRHTLRENRYPNRNHTLLRKGRPFAHPAAYRKQLPRIQPLAPRAAALYTQLPQPRHDP